MYEEKKSSISVNPVQEISFSRSKFIFPQHRITSTAKYTLPLIHSKATKYTERTRGASLRWGGNHASINAIKKEPIPDISPQPALFRSRLIVRLPATAGMIAKEMRSSLSGHRASLAVYSARQALSERVHAADNVFWWLPCMSRRLSVLELLYAATATSRETSALCAILAWPEIPFSLVMLLTFWGESVAMRRSNTYTRAKRWSAGGFLVWISSDEMFWNKSSIVSWWMSRLKMF